MSSPKRRLVASENPDAPGVSVVLVNYRRAADTLTCIEGIRSVEWPAGALEIIVVDNESGDGSAARIRAAAPDVTVIESSENVGFASGCNRGAIAASGRYLAFINSDARPDTRWIDAAVSVLERSADVACVASRVLDWKGESIDFVGAALSFYGHGFKVHAGDPYLDTHAEESDVLFASGAAMVIDARVFAAVGGFDDRYFMFFEDVDLGWRLWLLGYRVRYVPDSLVYHQHHASMTDVGSWREQFLLERNALFTIYKNYDDENLQAMLPAALTLAVARGVAIGGDDPHLLEVHAATKDDSPRVSVRKETLAGAYAVECFAEALDELTQTRASLQAERRRSDAEILPLFRQPLLPNSNLPQFLDRFDSVVQAFGVDRVFGRRRRILVVTGDTLQPAMAGPAIRAWHIAIALSREHDLVLASTTRCDGLSHPDFPVQLANGRQLRKLISWSDIIVFQGYTMSEHPTIRTSSKVVVADIYDPFHLEQLEQARDLGPERRRDVVRSSTDVLNEQLERGDLFLCASAKQRDFWLGQLAAVGRINPLTYDDDESMARLVSIVPFGVSDSPARHTSPALRGVVPGIGADDKVILWGGGIYNWFDPISLLHAVDKLRARVPEVRLYFLGLKHPNPHVPEMRMAVQAKELSDQLGLTGVHVFFNEGWVEYAERQNYLLESDLGVSTHLDHVETEFSFRTRILDYLWAGLPVVATAGDSLSDLIEQHDVGITVPAGDVDALEAALYALLTDPDLNERCRRNSAKLAEQYRWSTVMEPLVEFCRSPRRAPDVAFPDSAELMGLGHARRRGPSRVSRLQTDLRTLIDHFRRGEFVHIVHKALGRVRRALTS